jgi:RNase P subunit RPR2
MRLICPNLQCRRILSVPQNLRGRIIRCGACGTTIRVPEKKQPVETAEAEQDGA